MRLGNVSRETFCTDMWKTQNKPRHNTLARENGVLGAKAVLLVRLIFDFYTAVLGDFGNVTVYTISLSVSVCEVLTRIPHLRLFSTALLR